MTPRERLEYGYRLAFYPPELNRFWNSIKRSAVSATPETSKMLDLVMLLHQALPESGYASQRALNRLALYQAKSRAFGTLAFLRNIRRRLGLPDRPSADVLPAHLVRDIALPPLCHGRANKPHPTG